MASDVKIQERSPLLDMDLIQVIRILTTRGMLEYLIEQKFDGDLEAQERYLRHHFEKNPDWSTANDLLISFLKKQCRWEEIERHVDKYIRSKLPTSLMAGAFSEAVGHSGHFDKGESLYRKILADEPENINAHINLGYFLVVQGKDEDALKAYEQALQIKGLKNLDKARIYANMCCSLQKLDRLDEAVEIARKSVEANQYFSLGRSNLGSLLCRQEKFEEALPHCEAGVHNSTSSDGAYPNLNLAVCYLKLGRVDEAREQYTRGTTKKPHPAAAPPSLSMKRAAPSGFQKISSRRSAPKTAAGNFLPFSSI